MRTPRPSRWLFVVAGLAAGWLARPAAVWAGERLDIEWPSVFRVEANHPIPIETNQAVKVEVQGWNIPTFPVKLTEQPTFKLDRPELVGSHAPSLATLRSTPEATWFVAGTADGKGEVFRFDTATGRATLVSTFSP